MQLDCQRLSCFPRSFVLSGNIAVGLKITRFCRIICRFRVQFVKSPRHVQSKYAIVFSVYATFIITAKRVSPEPEQFTPLITHLTGVIFISITSMTVFYEVLNSISLL